jgi:hypothetical protein
MYCGEPDLPHLLRSISEQGVEVDHRIFSYMGEMEAHNAVYQAFNAGAPDQIRAKIDADIVLNPDALKGVAARCKPRSWIDPHAHDFFTDAQLHAGMAFYGPGVTFKMQTNTLKCDRGVANGCSRVNMGVIGTHAAHADELTGFHYGFHRGLKSQLPVNDRVVRAHAKYGDHVRLMAIRGFELGQSDRYIDWHLGRAPCPTDHYYGEKLQQLFDEFRVEDPPKLARTWR